MYRKGYENLTNIADQIIAGTYQPPQKVEEEEVNTSLLRRPNRNAQREEPKDSTNLTEQMMLDYITYMRATQQEYLEARTGTTPQSSGGSNAPNREELARGIVETAKAIGADPVELATVISYETAGTFNPTQRGPTTKWGQHEGLIQFGEPQQRQYGYDRTNPYGSQLGPNGAVARYLTSNGFKSGMGILDMYSIINAGGPDRYNASDTAAGGAPGTVRDKVEQQMSGHRTKAINLLQGFI